MGLRRWREQIAMKTESQMELIETERKEWKLRTNVEENELNRRTKVKSMFSRELEKGKWRKWSEKEGKNQNEEE